MARPRTWGSFLLRRYFSRPSPVSCYRGRKGVLNLTTYVLFSRHTFLHDSRKRAHSRSEFINKWFPVIPMVISRYGTAKFCYKYFHFSANEAKSKLCHIKQKWWEWKNKEGSREKNRQNLLPKTFTWRWKFTTFTYVILKCAILSLTSLIWRGPK